VFFSATKPRKPDRTPILIIMSKTVGKNNFNSVKIIIEVSFNVDGYNNTMIINKSFRTIAISLVTFFTISIPVSIEVKAQKNGFISSYVGIWSGKGNQTNDTEWSILLSIVPGSVNSVVGTIAYPSLGCGGELTLKQARNGSIELFENLTYGMDRCVNRGTTVLKTTSNRRLKFTWFNSEGQQEATGALGKISSN
jgi:hypothetical protein